MGNRYEQEEFDQVIRFSQTRNLLILCNLLFLRLCVGTSQTQWA